MPKVIILGGSGMTLALGAPGHDIWPYRGAWQWRGLEEKGSRLPLGGGAMKASDKPAPPHVVIRADMAGLAAVRALSRARSRCS